MFVTGLVYRNRIVVVSTVLGTPVSRYDRGEVYGCCRAVLCLVQSKERGVVGP